MEFTKPLKTLKLRTARLSSVESAKFGMVRRNSDGSPRAHQGVDFAVDSGYRCYAIHSGKVVSVENSRSGYGKTVCIKLDDVHKYKDANGVEHEAELYAFYAHLSKTYATVGQVIPYSQVIGLSGSTGNASGMTVIGSGAHLHFEIRLEPRPGLGLRGRIDPLQFFDLD